jgi:hypothetical protein
MINIEVVLTTCKKCNNYFIIITNDKY